MKKIIKKFIPVFICTLILFCTIFPFGFAENFSVYTSTLKSSTYAETLYGIYANSQYYDPSLKWIIWCSANNTYILAVESEKDQFTFTSSSVSSSDVTRIYTLRYVSSSGSISSHYEKEFRNVSSFNLSYGQYIVLGNFEGTVQPSYSETFDFHFMAIPLLILLSFAILFYVFRLKFDKDRSFKL